MAREQADVMRERIERDLRRVREMAAYRRGVLARQIEELVGKAGRDLEGLAAGVPAYLNTGNYAEFCGRIDAAAAEVYQMEQQAKALEDILNHPEG